MKVQAQALPNQFELSTSGFVHSTGKLTFAQLGNSSCLLVSERNVQISPA